jgi:hypothetical protein
MENRIQPHILSEKLYDAFLGWSLPIYWGAPNVSDYFPNESVLAVDVSNPGAALRAVMTAIDRNLQDERAEAVGDARTVALGPMNWTERLARVACDVFAQRQGSLRTPHRLTLPRIASHVGYRALNADKE